MPRRKKNDIKELLALPHVHERDGRAFVRIWYQDAGGKWKSKERRVETVEEAITTIARIKRELGLRGPEAFDGERMTFTELLDQFLIGNPKMPKWYSDPLREYFGVRRIVTITYTDLKRFKTARERVPSKATGERRSPTTINRELEWLRAVLLYAVRHKWIAGNPFGAGDQPLISKTEEQQRSRVPSPEEEARILEFCLDFRAWVDKKREASGRAREWLVEAVGLEVVDRIETDESVRLSDAIKVADALGESRKVALSIARARRSYLIPILIALRDTGLRKSALLSLTWAQVDLVEGFLRIPKGPRNKKRPPLIAMTSRLRDELLKLWEESDKKLTSRIFGEVRDFKKAYAKACELAGVKDLRVHDWRHGFATDLLEAGVEERLAMRATGHTNAETHAIYTNVDERLARLIASRLDLLHQSRRGGEEVTAGELVN